MPFDTFVSQITVAGFHAIYLAPFLMGAYIAWRHQASRRGTPVVAQVP